MPGITRLSRAPTIEADDDGIIATFKSGDTSMQFSMSWHHFTVALGAAKKLHAEGELARRSKIVPFKASAS